MGILGDMKFRFRSLFRGDAMDSDLDEEIRLHLELETEKNLRSGMEREEARRQALLAFGGVSRYRSEARDSRGIRFLEEVGQDLRLAARALRRSPGFSVTAIATLALGIGVNVAIFSLLDSVLLRPLPVQAPDRLIAVYEAQNERSPRRGGVAYPTYKDLAAAETGLSGLAAHVEQAVELQVGETGERASAAMVSGNYFQVLGIGVEVGRPLLPSDEAAPGSTPVAVISHPLWLRQFGENPAVVGKTIRIGGSPFTVVGVAPKGFRGVSLSSQPDLWVPITMAPVVSAGGLFSAPNALTTREFHILRLVGRLREAVTLDQAVAGLNAARLSIADDASLAPDIAAPMGALSLVEAAAVGDRDSLVRFLLLLTAVSALTLLVACVNVANLLLVRGRKRERELGIRAALGAGRRRLFRQLAVENLFLAFLGGVCAIAVAYATAGLLAAFTLPGDVVVPRSELGVDGAMLGWALLLALGTGLLFGLLPAARVSQTGAPALGSRTTTSPGAARGRAILVAVQVGVSLMLLVGAGLFARTLQKALSADLGFRADGVAAASVGLRQHGYTNANATSFVGGVLSTLQSDPSVSSAAFGLHIPLAPRAMALPVDAKDGAGRIDDGMNLNTVAGDYFGLLGIPLLQGRDFTATDDADAEAVAVVNASAARLMWPGLDPLGQRLQLFPPFGKEAVVVGVVADAKYHTVTDVAVPYLYLPFAQQPGLAMTEAHFLARGTSDPQTALAALRRSIGDIAPALPLFGARHVDRQIASVLAPQRFGATLLGLFSVLALLIASVGVYGVAAQSVARERREIGIRIALGARASRVVRTVLGGVLAASAAGAVAGLVTAAGLTRLVGSFLYGVTPLDPVAFAGALVILGVAVVVASAGPAWRAAAVDPASTLREE